MNIKGFTGKTLTLAALLMLALAALPGTDAAAVSAAGSAAVRDDDDDRGRGRGRGRGGKDKGDRGRKGRGGDDDGRRHEWRDRGSRRANWGGWGQNVPQWQDDRRARRVVRERYEDDRRYDRRYERHNRERYNRPDRRVYSVPQQWSQWFPVNNWNRGQQVREQRHWRNSQRKQYKEAQKAERRYEKQQRRHRNAYYNNYYGYNAPSYNYEYYEEPRRSGWKQQLLTGVLSSVLGGQLGGFDRVIPSQGYSPYYAPQQQVTYAPVYSPVYADAPDYGYRAPSGLGGILQALPVADIIQQYTGGNEFVSSIVSNAVGYDGGAYQDIGYDDTVLANDYYGEVPYQQPSNGTSDLVSMLLSSVLSGV